MSRFDEFWSLYPRRVAKIAARKAWDKHQCDDIADKVMAGLKRQLPHWHDPKFIPHPASWLNAGRWDDQPLDELRPPPVRQAAAPPPPPPQDDPWRAMINVWILDIVQSMRGVEIDVLRALVGERNRLAAQCQAMWGTDIERREPDVCRGMVTRLLEIAGAQSHHRSGTPTG